MFLQYVLTRMVLNAQQNYLIEGLAGNLVDKGVAILQYADDTILCIKDYLDMARNMYCLLHIYEMLSSLKINFPKSDVIW
jgi:hypothetical protein